jgi:3'-phosphoadenosine 5'-phosphosulfate sulfotransferase (PAPS reductase)/FAD synthetase
MKRDAQKYGTDGLTLLFTDTREEDEDTYRFLRESAQNIGAPLTIVRDGRSIWELFKDERVIGNNRMDACSKKLKREVADRWLRENCTPANTTVLLGYDGEEVHRFRKTKARYEALGYGCRAPLCEEPVLSRGEIKAWARAEGLEEQTLYKEGFHHANCGGFCVRSGHAHFRHLLKMRPATYARHEEEEQKMREFLQKDVAIMRDRRGGSSRPMTMKEFRERVEGGGECDPYDWGGCGCFSEE